MQDEMPANELAAKLMGDIDDMHNEELDDLLKDLFALRANELKQNMLAMAESEANAKATIAKNMKARRRAMKELHGKLDEKVEAEDPEALAAQKKAQMDALEQEEKNQIAEVAAEFARKKKAMEDELAKKALEKENERVQALKEKQIEEKKETIERAVPNYDEELKRIIEDLDT